MTVQESKQFWQDHINKFSTFSGSTAKYCLENNLRENQFYYHKKKLLKKAAKKPFVKVEVKPEIPTQQSLPDPKWLAQFILSLSGKKL